MEEPALSQSQQDSKHDLLQKAVAYEEIVHSKGFAYLKTYVRDQIGVFTTDALNGFSHEEYLERRGEVNGLRKLLGDVEFALAALEDERTNQPTKTG